MRTLNIREGDTQGQTKPIFDLYKYSLEAVMDSDIDDRVPGKNNPLQPSTPSALAF